MNEAATIPVIERDVPCYRCGYCLRGLGEDARCPECGGQVKASLGRPYLASAPPWYLKRLMTGFSLTIVLFVWTLVSDSMFFVSESALWAYDYYTRVRVVNMVMAIVAVASTIRLTTHLPAWRAWMPPDALRQAARVMAFIQAFCGAADMLTAISPLPFAYPVQYCELNTLFTLPWVLLVAFTAGYLRLLARRIPDARLAAASGFFMVTLSLVQWLYVPVSILFYDTGGPIDPRMQWAYDGRYGLIHGLVITEMVLTAWGIWFLYRWRRRLRGFLKAAAGPREVNAHAG